MCTLSWLRSAGGYVVFMNRDERPGRAPGLPPRPHERDGVRWLAPEDGDRFGTWIGANDRGLTLAILNRWDETPVGDGGVTTSRGHLVMDLLPSPSSDHVARRLEGLPLRRYRPFTLAAFTPDEPVAVFAWNGRTLDRRELAEPGFALASSGHDQDGATEVRRTLFAAMPPVPEVYEELHRSHRPERGAYSICMHRPQASTVSLTRVDVTPALVTMAYVPGPPCVTADRLEQRLPRPAPSRPA